MTRKVATFFVFSLMALSLEAAPFKMPVLRQSFRFVPTPSSGSPALVKVSNPATLNPESERCLAQGISEYTKLLDEVANNQTPWLASSSGSLVAILAKQGVQEIQVLFRDVDVSGGAQSSIPVYKKFFDYVTGSASDQPLREILAKFVFDTPARVDAQRRILQISITRVGPYCGTSGQGSFFDLDRNKTLGFRDADFQAKRISSFDIFRNFADETKTHWWNPLETGIQQDESQTIYSSGTMTFDDQEYPKVVDLAGELEAYKQVQLGGTCHVYTAVNLAEATCYRRIHRHVSISEAYLFYRHLANKFGAESFTWKGSGAATNGSSGDFFNDSIDGGQVENTLDRINNGSVCPRETFVFDQRFITFLGAMAAQRTNSRNLLAQLNSFAKERLENTQLPFSPDENNYGYRATSIVDPELKACLQKKMVVKTSNNPDVLSWSLYLLSRGKPFSCSYQTTGGRHVMTVLGYRFNESFPRNVEYQVMDSNKNSPEWSWKISGCDRITWIE